MKKITTLLLFLFVMLASTSTATNAPQTTAAASEYEKAVNECATTTVDAVTAATMIESAQTTCVEAQIHETAVTTKAKKKKIFWL